MEKSKRILLKLIFHGGGYFGWQAQSGGNTVQQTVQDAFETVFGFRPGVSGCGRTDSGVHALSYYCHADIPAALAPERIAAGLNLFFNAKGKNIAVAVAEEVSGDFHARYFIKSKEYIYKIQNDSFHDPFWAGRALHYFGKIDLCAMREAGSFFLGEHNFTSFMAKRSDIPPEEAVRRFFSLDITESIGQSRIIEIKMRAQGFLYKMARIIAGTLLEVSEGKKRPGEIPEIIAAKSRAAAGRTLPAHGLYLAGIEFMTHQEAAAAEAEAARRLKKAGALNDYDGEE